MCSIKSSNREETILRVLSELSEDLDEEFPVSSLVSYIVPQSQLEVRWLRAVLQVLDNNINNNYNNNSCPRVYDTDKRMPGTKINAG